MLLVVATLTVTSCGSTEDVTQKSVDGIYAKALEEYKSGDLLEAQRLFDLIKLQYPASQYADDAQYYISEIYYKKKEFILASFNYNYLRRVFPNSEYAKTALYKVAQSYVELSPPFDRDQEYTRKAIIALAEFQVAFPNDSLSILATQQIGEMRDKLAMRDFDIAEQYRVLLSPKSALIYYDSVLESYPDTPTGELSYKNRIETLIELKRYEEALSAISLYAKLYPKGRFTTELQQLKQQAEKGTPSASK